MIHYTLDDVQTLMRALRDPDTGCPWDLKQTLATIVPHTIEEAYEVAHAIESGDTDDIVQELGDLLFQVIFYTQLGQESGDFGWQAVVDTLVTKLLRRHPHVFPDGTLASAGLSQTGIDEQRVKVNWEAIKREERVAKEKTSLLADIPSALPAITRANKLQKRAATVGFDWTSVGAGFGQN